MSRDIFNTYNNRKYSQKIHDEYLMNENSIQDIFIRNPLNIWQIFSEYVFNTKNICNTYVTGIDQKKI